MAAVAYAEARGITVIATTRNPEHIDGLKVLGADHVVIDNGTIHKQIKEIVPEGADYALELVGAPTLLDTMESIRLWGQVVVVGVLGGPPILEKLNLMDLPNTVRLSFFGSGLLGSEAMPLMDSLLNWIAGQMESGNIPSIHSRTFKSEDISSAHSLLDSGKAGGKIVVTF